MKQYCEVLKFILNNGYKKDDRTNTGTISYFSPPKSTYWMDEGFPLLGTKFTWFKGIVHERLWFIGALPEEYKKFGNTNIKYLVDHDVHIWDEWAYEQYVEHCTTILENANSKYNMNLDIEEIHSQEWFINEIKTNDDFAMDWGELGSVYGEQFRRWNAGSERIDQLQQAIDSLKNAPDSRRIIINLWNVGKLDEMALPPCHSIPVQFWSRPLSLKERMDCYDENPHLHVEFEGWESEDTVHDMLDSIDIPRRALSSMMYQRSADYMLGVPFNIASDALFLHMIAQVTNHVPEKFDHVMGDAHVYLNHLEGAREVLRRYEQEEHYPLPQLNLNPDVKNIEDFSFEDITLENYEYHPKISFEVAV